MIDTVVMGGGAEQLLATLVPEMQTRGADVEIAVLFDQPVELDAEIQRAGVTLHRLKLQSRFSVGDAARKLRALVREGRYDVFWGHLYYGNFYASLAKWLAPRGVVAVTLHSEGYLHAHPNRLRERFLVTVERRALRAADLRVAVSQAVRGDYEAFFGLKDIQVIYNGIDIRNIEALSAFESTSANARFGFGRRDFLVVTPGSFIPKKGHRVWLDAIRILDDRYGIRVKAVMCGNGPYERIVGEAAHRGLIDQVRVSPAIPHEQLVPLIASAQAIVLPSLREPFGIAAAEAMALGKACVLTDVDGFRELTADADCALVVPPGDPSALAEAVAKLYRDPKLAADLGKRARTHIRANFDISNCARQWLDALRGVATQVVST